MRLTTQRSRARRRAGVWLVTLELLALALPLSAGAAPGDLDTSFGGDGAEVLVSDPDVRTTVALDAAVQPDGKVVAVGSAHGLGLRSSILVVRYNTDGTLDASFGGDGVIEAAFGKRSYGEAVALQPDGRIVVVGTSGARFIPEPTSVAVARYLPNGDLDRSFAGDGRRTLRFDDIHSLGADVLIRPDGEIAVLGSTEPIGPKPLRGRRVTNLLGIAQLKPNGRLDSGFADDGTRVISFKWFGAGTHGIATAFALQGRKVVLGGWWRDRIPVPREVYVALARVKPDGALDRRFGASGRVLTQFERANFAEDLAVDSTGEIVVVGQAGERGHEHDFVARYTRAGKVDRAFGSNGVTTVPPGQSNYGPVPFVPSAVAIQPDQRIVVAGAAVEPGEPFSHESFALARLNAEGSIDPSFGGDGMATYNLSSRGGGDRALGLALDSASRIIAVGAANLPDEHNVYYDRFSLIRVLGGS
jgi:uncharacterized delta-60 repeat protein